MQQRTSWLRDELKRAKEMGLTVQIDDKICQYQKPEEFFYVLEEEPYMLDYLSDDNGKIIGLCFNRLSEEDLV